MEVYKNSFRKDGKFWQIFETEGYKDDLEKYIELRSEVDYFKINNYKIRTTKDTKQGKINYHVYTGNNKIVYHFN